MCIVYVFLLCDMISYAILGINIAFTLQDAGGGYASDRLGSFCAKTSRETHRQTDQPHRHPTVYSTYEAFVSCTCTNLTGLLPRE